MSVFRINPLTDPRWATLAAHHPHASVFHSPGWLRALHRTFGYVPFAVTTDAPGEPLKNGLVLCRVKSWLTGDRIVSVPFADHCQPLVTSEWEVGHLISSVATRGARYLEIRPTRAFQAQMPLERTQSFCLHMMPLDGSEAALTSRFHRSCVLRKIRRTSRERLSYEEGRSEALLAAFYKLLVATRLRHGVPVQPLTWFRNLIACMGDALKIRVSSQDGRPVAAILTLQHGDAMVYKYGGSDAKKLNLGGMQALLWAAIQEARAQRLRVFDMGRSDTDDHGLIQFKDRWGAVRTDMTYLRYSTRPVGSRSSSLVMRMARQIAQRTPPPLLYLAGKALYGHWG